MKLTTEQKETIYQAFQTFGHVSQRNKLVEEVAELLQAIQTGERAQFHEELADVIIVTAQFLPTASMLDMAGGTFEPAAPRFDLVERLVDSLVEITHTDPSNLVCAAPDHHLSLLFRECVRFVDVDTQRWIDSKVARLAARLTPAELASAIPTSLLALEERGLLPALELMGGLLISQDAKHGLTSWMDKWEVDHVQHCLGHLEQPHRLDTDSGYPNLAHAAVRAVMALGCYLEAEEPGEEAPRSAPLTLRGGRG
jgi:hypothetical protein